MHELTPDEQLGVLRTEFTDKAVELRLFPTRRPKILAELDSVLDMANIIQLRLEWEPEMPDG